MPKAPHKLHFAVIAADTVACRVNEGRLEVLLIPITNPHFAGTEGLPGGLIAPEETAEQAARRHLAVKGGLSDGYFEQLYTFSDIDRDPRGRVVSVAYLGLFAPDDTQPSDQAGRSGVRWCPVTQLPSLAYDHSTMVRTAIERLRARISYTTIVRYLLPNAFTLTDLQSTYEMILGYALDKRNFRKKFLALDLLADTGRKRTQGASRPALLYRFATKRVQSIEIL